MSIGSGLLFPPELQRTDAGKNLRLEKRRSVRQTDAVKSEQPNWLSYKEGERKRDTKAREKSLLRR